MQGSHGGIDLPQSDITRAKNHLAKYYKKMGETAPGSGADGAPARRPAPAARGIMPLWLGGGLADWCLHRRTHIQVGVPGRAETGSTAYHRGRTG
jgi:hypothetical protein